MDSLMKQTTSHPKMGGFTLIELMIAMVLGLIVIGAVLALSLSLLRANNQTIAGTRLTQELRAVAGLMANDIRRAGGVVDPLTVATANNGNPLNPFRVINTATAGCIQYSYAGADGGNFRAINFRQGAAFLDAGAAAADATCDGGTRLSSPQVTITGLAFERQSPCGTANATGRCIRITLAGRLTGDPTITRQYTQDIYVRSIAGT